MGQKWCNSWFCLYQALFFSTSIILPFSLFILSIVYPCCCCFFHFYILPELESRKIQLSSPSVSKGQEVPIPVLYTHLLFLPDLNNGIPMTTYPLSEIRHLINLVCFLFYSWCLSSARMCKAWIARRAPNGFIATTVVKFIHNWWGARKIYWKISPNHTVN